MELKSLVGDMIHTNDEDRQEQHLKKNKKKGAATKKRKEKRERKEAATHLMGDGEEPFPCNTPIVKPLLPPVNVE